MLNRRLVQRRIPDLFSLILSAALACCGGGGSGGGGQNPPPAPTGLVATSGDAQVSLTWTASANANGYHIKRGAASGGPYSQIASSILPSYTDGSVTNGTSYYYVVSASNTAGESANSNEASATPQAPPPHTPTSYYVSPTGNDSWPGTLAQPFKTVQFAVNQLYAGDTLNIRDGSYHESVTVPRSGTASAPITIQAYTGECPALIGATPVAGPWTVYSGAIYKAPWPTQPLQVFSDTHLLNEARWPNTAIEDFAGQTYALAESGSYDFISYTGSDIPNVDLTGAWVRIMAGQAWVGYDRQVTSYDKTSGVLSFSPAINPTTDPNAMYQLVPRRGNHFYLFGKLDLLDSPGEWWWDPTSQQLYVWTQDGASPEGRIEAGTASAVLNLSGLSYVTVKSLSGRGGWFNLQNCTSCTLQDFHLWAPTWTRTVNGYGVQPEYLGGVDVSGSNNLLQGGSVRQAGRSAIHVMGTANTVQQVTIEDSGWNWAADPAIELNGANQLVQNNTIRRAALASIYLSPNSKVLNNLIDTSCIFAEDCGNINAWSMDGQGTEVAYNLIQGNHARWGAGIYLDAGSPNFYLHDNVIQDVLWSGMNITAVTKIENNTMLDAQHQSINFVPPANAIGADWSAGIVAHNQVVDPFPVDVMLAQPVSFIPDYGFYNAYTTLAPQPGPRRVEIDWTQLVQPGWSQQQVPMDLSTVTEIMFSIDIPASFNYTVSNLRLLPLGQTGDAGAVAVTGAAWTTNCSGGSTCSLSVTAPPTWGITGTNIFNGANSLSAQLPSGMTDLTPFRGLAFELAGTASRTFSFQGFQDVDNGPDATPGRGATLPANVGADPSGAWPACTPPPTPWARRSEYSHPTRTCTGRPLPAPASR